MERGTLYGVGVGPGDRELITLKAIRILQSAQVIAAPDKGQGEQTALNIVSEWIGGKPVLSCSAPMVHDRSVLDQAHTQAADQICDVLDQGKSVAFITLGHPTVYSTYIYIHRKVMERGYPVELVPGVPSFCAAAAKLNTSLCQGQERLLIVPACHHVEDTFSVQANKVYMKAGRSLESLKAGLAAHGQLERASAACNVGMDNEQIVPHLADLEGAPGYFSVVLVREEG